MCIYGIRRPVDRTIRSENTDSTVLENYISASMFSVYPSQSMVLSSVHDASNLIKCVHTKQSR